MPQDALNMPQDAVLLDLLGTPCFTGFGFVLGPQNRTNQQPTNQPVTSALGPAECAKRLNKKSFSYRLALQVYAGRAWEPEKPCGHFQKLCILQTAIWRYDADM